MLSQCHIQVEIMEGINYESNMGTESSHKETRKNIGQYRERERYQFPISNFSHSVS